MCTYDLKIKRKKSQKKPQKESKKKLGFKTPIAW